MTNRLLAATAGLVAAVALALAPVAAADAHDYLVSSDPAADATVTAPLSAMTLTFNDRVLDLSGKGSTNLLTVTGPDSGTRHFETGCATVADTALTAPVALGGAGRYTVTYQIVSADGHTVSSSYAFTYQPPAGATAAAGSEGSPCGATGSTEAGSSPGAGGSSAGATPPATAAASTAQPTTPASTGTDLGLVIGIAIGIVVLAVIGVAIVLLTSRRRPPAAPGAPEDPAGTD
ncbi:copper resistance protein CopC [Leifsonia shinshuensis]|uniref:copper resistance CopC family protein n=1 Tax=Leifsonia shinshuensis TaxID=150026 RepID=UPI002860D378|nr:copper resistance protein CopC [Leifsonia shinshuensis]MDR6972397.1 methionine-rich copper-binding protein CopC [Leifsonia shinshuensis]